MPRKFFAKGNAFTMKISTKNTLASDVPRFGADGPPRSWGRWFAAACLAISLAGCQSIPDRDHAQVHQSQSPIRIERGHPNRLLDQVGNVLSVPEKLALWDRRAGNHYISFETENELVDYILANDLDSVLVRSNQYDPIGEWRRLAGNERIGVGWRATFGTYSLLKYTLLPGRLIGGDWYNPYTHTLNLYSDIPALAVLVLPIAKIFKLGSGRVPTLLAKTFR